MAAPLFSSIGLPFASDPHSYAGSSPVRAHHLALVLAVNFDTRTLAGEATWQLTNPDAAPTVVIGGPV